MTKFRPCIDLHAGQVKQIVGGTLTDDSAELTTNHVSTLSPGHFAKLYKDHDLKGAHVIMLGPGNEEAAKEALAAWPKGLQIGGGIHERNAARWIELGAQKVIVTSYIFPQGKFDHIRLYDILNALDCNKHKLVLDLSCRKQGNKWMICTDKWQTVTNMELNRHAFRLFENACSEFLVHAADHEGLQNGIDEDLVKNLAEWTTYPVTYAGGATTIGDLDKVKWLSDGKVDLTIGSALDIFGGQGVKFEDCVKWNKDWSGGP